MLPITIPNRPFSTEMITGLMLPDGIFEASLGTQQLNAYFANTGAAALAGVDVYVESVSDPGIRVSPQTYTIGSLNGGASVLYNWAIDVSAATPGKHYVSFVARSAAGMSRIIQRIFVTRINFNSATKTFSVETPEGVMNVAINEVLTSGDPGCGCKGGNKDLADRYLRLYDAKNPVQSALKILKYLTMDDIKNCPPQTILLKKASVSLSPVPAYTGQYGDLPYQDPWWKTLLAILAVILFITAFVVAAVFGVVAVGYVTGGIGAVATIACCSVPFFVALGAAAASIGSAVIAGAADVRDPFRRGQDNTLPGAGETTVGENLNIEFSYPEPLVLGTPYAVGAKWDYHRITMDAASNQKEYAYSVDEVNSNIHTLSKYVITCPNVVRVYREEPFIIKGEFFSGQDKIMRGGQLFVKCFLVGPDSGNNVISFLMQDSGIYPDSEAGDGIYTGIYRFSEKQKGLWKIYVIAQDINNAQPDMTPDEAAQIIGGMVLTGQLTITFDGGTCKHVPDGDVNVIG
jgi:hypothetical protein